MVNTLRALLAVVLDDLRSKSERGALVRSATGTILLKGGSIGLAFAASLIYAHALGPHAYGQYAYVIAWTSVLAIPAGLGVAAYLVRQGARFPEHVLALRAWGDRWTLAGGLVILAVLLMASLVPASHGMRWLFVLAAPIPLLTNLGAVRGSLLQSRGYAVRSQWPPLLFGPALIIAGLSLLWMVKGTLDPLEVMAITLAGTFCQSLINHLQMRALVAGDRTADHPSHADSRLRSALPFMWIAGLFLLNSRTDLILLGSLKNSYEVGVYAIASRAAELTGLAMTATNTVLAPKIAQLHHAGDHATMRRLVHGAMRRVMAVSLPLGAVLFIGADWFLTFFYGERFAAGALVMRILIVAQVLVVGSGPLGTVLNMTGHTRANTNNMLIAVILNIVLNVLLIPRFGANGASIATAVSLVASRILLSFQARRYLGVQSLGRR
jgi:O-antigen/teichoic acid export membrane protein